MFKLFSAISYLHSANICHRDIKAENVLYETDDYDSDIKIIDFGLARKFGDTSMRSTVGSAFYVAPQVIM